MENGHTSSLLSVYFSLSVSARALCFAERIREWTLAPTSLIHSVRARHTSKHGFPIARAGNPIIYYSIALYGFSLNYNTIVDGMWNAEMYLYYQISNRDIILFRFPKFGPRGLPNPSSLLSFRSFSVIWKNIFF